MPPPRSPATRVVAASVVAVLAVALSGCGGSGTTSGTAASSGASSSGVSRGGGGGGLSTCSSSSTTPTAAPASAIPKSSDATTVAAAVTKAQAFLATLSTSEQAQVVFDYGDLDAKRCSWSNFPDGAFTGRQGARLGDLTDAQRTAAMEAVASLLSASGYTQVEQEMLADQQLASDGGGGAMFGEDNYHLAFYGDPSTDQPWTMQYGGHHLAVHISVGGDTLSVSPHFTGVQPITFTVDGTDYEPLKQDSDDLFGIFAGMSDTEKSAAELAGSYDDLVMGPGNDTAYPDQAGLPYTDLTTAQQALVQAAIADYVGDAADSLAQPLIDLYDSQLEQTTVGWAGSTDAGQQGAYLRIDGPRVWIEWYNTGNPGESGFHVHSVYRDKELDYGTGAG